jgi:hypothetical protein
MAKKHSVSDSGFVFETKGEKLDEKAVLLMAEEAESLGFDPDFLTSKIIEFGLALTGIPLYDYQREAAYRIIYSIVTKEGETITLLFARQSGKTECLAFVADTLCVILPVLAKVIPSLGEFKSGFRIGLFAPQSDQVTTTYSRALSRLKSDNATLIMEDSDIKTGLVYDSRLVLSNGSYLAGQTASKTSKIESKTYDLIFIEEAQDTDDLMVSKSIEPMLTATSGTLVKIGTTGTRKCDFWYEIQRNIKRSTGKNSGKLRYHFEYNYKEIIKQKRRQYEADKNLFHLNYEKFIEKQIEKRGINSDSFKLAYALIWSLETGMFITDQEWNKIINKKKSFIRVVEDDWDIRAGLDIAKDNASSVVTIVKVYPYEEFKPNKKEVINIIDLGGLDYEQQHEYFLDILVDYNVNTLYADYTGVGKPVVDRLTYACGDYVNIVPYIFTRPTKSEMWFNLRADIETGRLIIPASNSARDTPEYKNLESQIKGMIKWYDGGYLVANKGEDSDFDDYPDSLGLACLAGNSETPDTSKVEESDGNPFLNNSGILDSINKNSW